MKKIAESKLRPLYRQKKELVCWTPEGWDQADGLTVDPNFTLAGMEAIVDSAASAVFAGGSYNPQYLELMVFKGVLDLYTNWPVPCRTITTEDGKTDKLADLEKLRLLSQFINFSKLIPEEYGGLLSLAGETVKFYCEKAARPDRDAAVADAVSSLCGFVKDKLAAFPETLTEPPEVSNNDKQ